MNWTSEREALPPIAQDVLLAYPRQFNEFWDFSVSRILVRHEDVMLELPVEGERASTGFWWEGGGKGRDMILVTGRAWGAPLTGLTLPPGAMHQRIRDFDCIVKTESD